MLDVWGTQGLHGTVRVPGAKNSVLPLLAASLLCTQTVTLENVPGLTDVACAVRILRELGCGVRGPRKGVIEDVYKRQVMQRESACAASPCQLRHQGKG